MVDVTKTFFQIWPILRLKSNKRRPMKLVIKEERLGFLVTLRHLHRVTPAPKQNPIYQIVARKTANLNNS